MIKKAVAVFWGVFFLASLASAADSFHGVYGKGPEKFTLATGSPGELGLVQALAAKFIAFVASPQGQQIIKDYGKDRYGEGLYNDAAYARQYEK